MLRLDGDALRRVLAEVPRAPIVVAPACRALYDAVHRRTTGPRGGRPPTDRPGGGATWRYGWCRYGVPGDDGMVELARPHGNWTANVSQMAAALTRCRPGAARIHLDFGIKLDLVSGMPIDTLHLDRMPWWTARDTDALCRCGRLRALSLVLRNDDAALLAALPRLRLHALEVVCYPRVSVVAVPTLPRLRHLRLHSCPRLVWPPTLDALLTLDMAHCRVDRELLVLPPTLTRLSLRGCGVRRLGPVPPRLVELDLSHNLALACPTLACPDLVFLDMSCCGLSEAGALPPRLERLGLARNALETVPVLPARLRVLDLSDNPIGYVPHAVAWPPALEELLMLRTHVGAAEGVTRAVLDALPPTLRVLVLNGCPIGAWSAFWSRWMPDAARRLSRLQVLGLNAASKHDLGPLDRAVPRHVVTWLWAERREEWAEARGPRALEAGDYRLPFNGARDFMAGLFDTAAG